MVGASSDNIFYPHSNTSYALVTSREGAMQAVDITTSFGDTVHDPEWDLEKKAVLSPIAVSKGITKAAENRSVIVAAFEGQSPVVTTHGSDAYLLTSFNRLWRMDAMQIVPCGNVMSFFKGIFKNWTVPPGSTAKRAGTVSLKSAMRQGAAGVPWLCELSKKVIEVEGYPLAKNIACCNPKDAKQKKACCVGKDADVPEDMEAPKGSVARAVAEALQLL